MTSPGKAGLAAQILAANPPDAERLARLRQYELECHRILQPPAYHRAYRLRGNNAAIINRRQRQRYATVPAIRNAQHYRQRVRRARLHGAVCEHGAGCFHAGTADHPKRCAVKGCRRRKHLAADHIIPLSKGGLDCRHNLQILCRYHNGSKLARAPLDFLREQGQVPAIQLRL